jgi:hypothetical protein
MMRSHWESYGRPLERVWTQDRLYFLSWETEKGTLIKQGTEIGQGTESD